jgi:D-alanyl-D-alanine carboxypeptidase
MLRRTFLAVLPVIAAIACGSRPAAAPRAPAVPPPVPASAAHADVAAKVAALADAAAAENPDAGFSVAVVWHGEALLVKGYGLADRERATPVDAESVFRIGSITKQFAAALILRLAAEGKVSVDDELVKHLPDYPVHGRKITLRHLLTHTSGIPDYERAPWLKAHMGEDRPIAELVATFAAEPFAFETGAEWSYSNSNYLLLGQIVEKLTKRSFADAVEAMLADEGVHGVRYCPDVQDYPHAANGYSTTDGKPVPARPILMKYAGAAGAMCATPSGLVAWARALDAGAIVDAAALREMETPVALADGNRYNYGFGVFVGELGGHRVVYHSGGINGFAAKLAWYPDDELYIAIAVNADSGLADALSEPIAREVLGVAPPPPPEDLPIDPAEAQAVAGRYSIAAAGAVIVVEVDGDKLYAREEKDTERAQLQRQSDGSYAIPAAGSVTITFTRDGDRVTGLTITDSGMSFAGKRL